MLATLVRVEGSSYRRPGARMLIWPDGKMIGSLSAGCLEEEVTLRAREVFETGEPALISFDTRRRFGCAGRIDIFIERADEKFFIDLAQHLDARRSCVAVTLFTGDLNTCGSQVKAGPIDSIARRPPSGSDRLSEPPLPDHFEHSLVQEIHPPIRLWIFGDGSDNAAFHSLAQLLGWEMNTFVDANALALSPDRWTAAIVKSHNYGRDFAALQKLLPLNLRYVGLIGPRKRRDQLMNDLLDREIVVKAGFFAPAGLDLGSETPEEIALAIVSEIQLVFAAASGESLCERKIPIHANTPRSFQTFRLRAGQAPSRNPSAASNADTAGSFDSASLRSG